MSRYDAQRMVIRTPEGVEFGLLLAGPISRFLAWLIDTVCLAFAAIILSILVSAVIPIHGDIVAALSALLLYALFTGYRIVCEWFLRGQTIGKRLLRLRVIDAQGLRLGFSQVVIRNLLRFADALPFLYFVGGLLCVVSKRCQRLGDLAANTVVVREDTFATPNLDRALPDKFNSLKSYPHLAARLRQRVTPEAAKLALQALQRREMLSPGARVSLFAELAEFFRSLAPYPEDATFGMTDETYVRNVVDVVFGERKPVIRSMKRAAGTEEAGKDSNKAGLDQTG
ncbi:MAG TPA: RDD family protein [Candidatus Hydrogenedentes bacterium]|nr:RDD family protein [Candidatus Hydrogenedentota bacterium]